MNVEKHPRTLRFLLLLAGMILSSGLTQTCQKFEPEGFLHVNTGNASQLSIESAVLGGEVTDDGGSVVTARGICWSTSTGPALSGDHSTEGSGSGSFNSSLSGLTPGTMYYYRAYASNGAGTTYGKELSFQTLSQSLPTVSTSAASSLGKNAATLNGEVLDEGSSAVSERGFYFGSTADVEQNGHSIAVGSGSGSFTKVLDTLAPGATYYFMAYATNKGGTAYGAKLNFDTQAENKVPTVLSMEATVIRNDEATLNAEVSDDGGAAVSERGFYYGISTDPVNSGLKVDAGNGTGSYKKIIAGLASATTYYFVAYAANSIGEAYGTELSFVSARVDITGQTGTLTDIDENTYNWIGIGKQAWMAENLKTTRLADGTAIAYVADSVEWSNLGSSSKAYSWQHKVLENPDTYGMLYTWAAAMNGATGTDANPSQVQGVCPDGWHLPSDSEWKELEIFLGMDPGVVDDRDSRGTLEGGMMKVQGLDYWKSPNRDATNSTGFSGLPGGYRDDDGELELLGDFGYFWSTTHHEDYNALIRRLDYWNSKVYRNPFHLSCGMSVRCVKD